MALMALSVSNILLLLDVGLLPHPVRTQDYRLKTLDSESDMPVFSVTSDRGYIDNVYDNLLVYTCTRFTNEQIELY